MTDQKHPFNNQEVPVTEVEIVGSSAPDVVSQLRDLTTQGLPLPVALRACAEESSSFGAAAELRRLSQLIESGVSLEEALRSTSTRLKEISELILAGIQSGKLPWVLEAYIMTQRQNRDIWRRFWLSILYPLIVLVASVLLFMAILVIPVQMFKDIFLDFGIELPSMTMVLIACSDHFTMLWPFYVGLAIAVIALLLFSPWIPLLRFWRYIPIVRTAALQAGLAEFCSLLAVLVDAGAPLHKALAAISTSAHSYRIRDLSALLARRLADGLTPELATDDPDLPADLVHVFRWASQREQFAQALRYQSRALAAEARVGVRIVAFIMEPLVIVSMGFAAGFIILSLFMPLIRLLNELS